ncbi:unnamed protein product [Paramecium pentaurelia]|uniref:Uncharacterized protein n=1 Tax=Paramecium pentaurelia TaxID=43138 RepID=A0A8S1W4E7_9CILI|nr:unnamed protein product [Paramecium pentaurelia]
MMHNKINLMILNLRLQNNSMILLKMIQFFNQKDYLEHSKVQKEKYEQELNNKVNLQLYINHFEMGNLIAIKLQNYMLYCLILSEQFFITKTINEKSIEIVLLRILQDLTDNIKLFLSDSIQKQNQYQGEVNPFSAQMLLTNEYDFAKEQNQEVKLYDCKLHLSSDLKDFEIINSKTLQHKLTSIRSIEFDEKNYKSACNHFYQKLLFLIFSPYNDGIYINH